MADTALHVIKGTGAPTQAPAAGVCHYLDEATGDQYLAEAGAWQKVGATQGGGGGLAVGDALVTVRAPGGDFLRAGITVERAAYPVLSAVMPQQYINETISEAPKPSNIDGEAAFAFAGGGLAFVVASDRTTFHTIVGSTVAGRLRPSIGADVTCPVAAYAGAADGLLVFAAGLDGACAVSSDSGATWTTRAGTWTGQATQAAVNGARIIVAAGALLYYSDDSGVTWAAQDTDNGSDPLDDLLILDDGTLLASYGHYVWWSRVHVTGDPDEWNSIFLDDGPVRLCGSGREAFAVYNQGGEARLIDLELGDGEFALPEAGVPGIAGSVQGLTMTRSGVFCIAAKPDDSWDRLWFWRPGRAADGWFSMGFMTDPAVALAVGVIAADASVEYGGPVLEAIVGVRLGSSDTAFRFQGDELKFDPRSQMQTPAISAPAPARAYIKAQ
ncbi:hypothetical protein [Pseudomonas sp.]|uniref:hypothetical protein n=1 Tax=Pseudomonas sp. TaxID=306 RepID=UPI00290712DD|nr:hypothetical protein [Pseudomonas sp.]MDU4253930.1 hypothetical protein [Pseudomonas sp.]